MLRSRSQFPRYAHSLRDWDYDPHFGDQERLAFCDSGSPTEAQVKSNMKEKSGRAALE